VNTDNIHIHALTIGPAEKKDSVFVLPLNQCLGNQPHKTVNTQK